RDRSAEVEQDLSRISAGLERELGPAARPLPDEERGDVERKLERLDRRREQLGPVNPLAEREYEDAKADLDELSEQREDLEGALAELRKLIKETDETIARAFEETLEKTSKNFEELVEHLFPGGRGRLRLVQPQTPRQVLGGGQGAPDSPAGAPEADPAGPGLGGVQSAGARAAEGAAHAEPVAAEAPGVGEGEEDAGLGMDADERGVEIEVTPAGKATRRLSLLSGGEKSLVALAFVFAVFLARPSPFYILDEVEAALDDANIDRFLQLVRQFSDRAQFVIVTHQKRTMDAADVLYGVSMGEGGITKVVSRRLPREAEGATSAEAGSEQAA
ncbi:MAG: AAA family ATPase, partial [Solirubrobacterales bacterium]